MSNNTSDNSSDIGICYIEAIEFDKKSDSSIVSDCFLNIIKDSVIIQDKVLYIIK